MQVRILHICSSTFLPDNHIYIHIRYSFSHQDHEPLEMIKASSHPQMGGDFGLVSFGKGFFGFQEFHQLEISENPSSSSAHMLGEIIMSFGWKFSLVLRRLTKTKKEVIGALGIYMYIHVVEYAGSENGLKHFVYVKYDGLDIKVQDICAVSTRQLSLSFLVWPCVQLWCNVNNGELS